jgi:two-component system, OmpR family, response regulator VicR
MKEESQTSSAVPKRILVVDDNADIRNLISLILTTESYEVMVVDSGSALLEEIGNFNPDLLLLDIMMPRMSGFEVLKIVRSLPDAHLSSIPIVMITAKSMDADVEQALALGATSYIVKPFRAEALKHKVSAQLSQGAVGR